MIIQHIETFRCKPASLFIWLGEPEKAMAWMKSVSKTEILNRTKDMVGTTFREVVAEGKGSIEMSGIITEYIENSTIAFHLDSKVNSLNVKYSIEIIGDATDLTVTSEVHWKFPINVLSIFLSNKMKAGILAQLKSELSALRRLCE